MTKLVVATRSAHKLREIRQLIGPLPGIRILDLEEAGIPETESEDGIEIHDSFEENALAKARYFAATTNVAVLADDSGLCVDELGGAPGVRSKRFSGRTDLRGAALDQANNAVLLGRLEGLTTDRRSAHFACAVALATPDGREAVFLGRCGGHIQTAPSGTAGFGYDPLFFAHELGKTFAEADAAEKNRVSHRARAIGAARELLATGWIHLPKS